MLIRRKNWPAFLAIAILGPLFGVFLAAKFLPFDVCSNGADETAESAPKVVERNADEKHHTSEELLQLPDGDRVALDEIAPSRAVAVVVMKGPWCPVCQRQLKRLSAQLDDVRAVGATVVGLNAAPPEKNRRLAEKLGLNFPVLSDASKRLLRKFRMWREGACHAIPGVVFLDESGDVVRVHRGRYPGQPQDEFVLQTLRKVSE